MQLPSSIQAASSDSSSRNTLMLKELYHPSHPDKTNGTTSIRKKNTAKYFPRRQYSCGLNPALNGKTPTKIGSPAIQP
jgi:hypothetical protein